ncbi:hypothetical protein FACS1894123_02700 [Bacteroidia bacterium]|nr:hypothetical protein FACS1894123_02700 [Bacteroidia bacterium]
MAEFKFTFKKHMGKDKSATYKISEYIYIFVFAIFAAGWLFVYNRYRVISAHEEMQLFRLEAGYFHDYLIKPGGIVRYIGSFLTQYYHFHWLGALIIVLSIVSASLLLAVACRQKNGVTGFSILWTMFPVFLLFSVVSIYFNLSEILGLIFSLVLFLTSNIFYRKNIKLGLRIGIDLFLCGITCLFAAGNALLFAALVLIRELNGKRSFLYILSIMTFTAALPYFLHLFVYIATLRKCYFSLTPWESDGNIPFSQPYIIAWLLAPIVFQGKFLPKFISKPFDKIKPWVWVLFNFAVIIAIVSCWGIKKFTDKEGETMSSMAYHAEFGEWGKVLEIGSDYNRDKCNQVISYFTNLALSEKGTLASEMFHYYQPGTNGLFLEWKVLQYQYMWDIGELFYRMGIIPEAEHCAFESMISPFFEYGSRPLRRILYTSMLRRDTGEFNKYARFFEVSPVYRKWAKQQREHYAKYQSDTTYVIPGLPRYAKYNDFYADHSQSEYNLIVLLRTEKQNKKAFEYLMASILVQKNMPLFLSAMDKYYFNMGYDQMPRHLEEALLVCQVLYEDKADFIGKFPISDAATESFLKYNDEVKNNKGLKAANFLKKSYGNTYWYYYQYVQPDKVKNDEEAPPIS